MDPIQQMYDAVEAGDAKAVRDLASRHPELMADTKRVRYWLVDAGDHVDVIEALVEAGADINSGKDAKRPEGVIKQAVDNNAIQAVRWMLAHGAKLNFEVEGEKRCFALVGAVMNGNLEMVKLLVEFGADPNAVWRRELNALSYVNPHKHPEIEQYLRSIGAKEAWEIVGGNPPTKHPALDSE